MVGPLFYHEMLLGSRRSRDYIFRWVYVGWLLLQLGWIAFFDKVLTWTGTINQAYVAYVGRHFAEVFIPQHFALLALVTPAFVASAITEEKTRGTLQYLLTTDLAPIHIIVGKLLGRIIQVCVLAAAGLPFFAILGAFGGIEPALMLGLIFLTVYVAAGVASATFLAAVWARQTRDAVIGLYAVGIVAATIVYKVGGPLEYFNPVALLAPIRDVSGLTAVRLLGQQLVLGLLAWGGLTLVCLALAAWRLRPAYIKQLQGEGRPGKRRWWLPSRPAVGEQPIRWKERHVEGLAPVPWLRFVPRWLGIVLTAGATILGSCGILYFNRLPGVTPEALLGMATSGQFLALAQAIDWPGASDGFWLQCSLALNVFALLVAVRCSGSVTGERERQTWEALLLTPLTVEHLIRGKLWGITLVSYIYLLAYAVPALVLSLFGGPGAVFWTVLYLGVTLLAMYYLGGVAMWSSVRARGSWRSLLTTILVAYLIALLLYVVLLPAVGVVCLLIFLVLTLTANYFGINAGGIWTGFGGFFFAFLIATCIGLAAFFYVAARMFLRSAQKWVAERERTRHWENEPIASDGLRSRKRRRRFVRET
jgi:ABC-type Na+ efflux pump permease subunit